MPAVQMPDGQVVDMPDQLPPELGTRLRAYHQSLTAPPPDATLRTPVARNPTLNPSKLPASNASPGEMAQAAASGVNSGALSVAGAPVDAATGLINLIRKAVGMDAMSGTPVGGSESLHNAARAISPSTVDAQPTAHGADLSGLHTAASFVGPGELARGGELAQRGVQAATGLAEHLTGTAGRDVSQAASGAVRPAIGTGQTAIETGRAAGFKFTPGSVESRMPAEAVQGQIPQALGTVTPDDVRKVNLHNQAKTTELAGAQIGKPGATQLSKADFDAARKPHQQTYNETGQLVGSGLTGSPDLVNALKERLADNTQTALKGAAAAQTQRILAAASSGNLSGSQMVKDISWLRQNGGGSVARMLEDEMERNLTSAPDQLQKFRDARTGFAQIRNLQDVTKGGQIDASRLAALDQKKPGLLTGNLKLIAQSAAASPTDFRMPSGLQPGSSVVDSPPTVASITSRAMAPVLRTVAPSRFDVNAPSFQNRFGKEASPEAMSYTPDLGKKPPAESPPRLGAARQLEYSGPGQTPLPMGQDRFQGEGGVASGHPGEARPASLGTILANQPPALPPPGGTVIPLPNHLGSELDAARAAREAEAARAAPGHPHAADFGLMQDNAPRALPAPGETAPRGAQLPAIKVTPAGKARLSDPVRDFAKDDAAATNPSRTRDADIGTMMAKSERIAQPSVGRQVVDRLDPTTVAEELAKVGMPAKKPTSRIREDYLRQQREKRGKN